MQATSQRFRPIPVHSVQTHIRVLPLQRFSKNELLVDSSRLDNINLTAFSALTELLQIHSKSLFRKYAVIFIAWLI